MTINKTHKITLSDEYFNTFVRLDNGGDTINLHVDGDFVVGGVATELGFNREQAIAVAEAMLELAEKLDD